MERIYPHDLPESGWLLGKLIKWLSGLFKRPKKNKPDDIAERNRQMREFCDMVNQNAKQTEQAVIEALRQYGTYLTELSQSDEFSLLGRHRIQTRGLARQVDWAEIQIPGIIASEVSRRLSETDSEYQRIRLMLPGADKEQAMRSFMNQIITGAVEKCASVCENLMEDIEEEFMNLLEEDLDRSRRQLEKKEEELEQLRLSAGDMIQKETIRTQARQVINCCDFVRELL